MSSDIRSKILEELRNIEIPGLLSCSIVGSFSQAKELGWIDDIDVYHIFKEMAPNIFKKTIRFYQEVCKRLSDEEYEFIIELKQGAFKPSKGERKRIQFHILINTLEQAKKTSPTSLDWSLRFFPLKGKKLDELIRVKSIPKKDLIEGRKGLTNFLRILEEGKIFYVEWSIQGSEMERNEKDYQLKEEEWFEAIQFAVLTGYMNFIRFQNPRFQKTSEGFLEMSKHLPENYQKLVEEVLYLKKRFKEGEELDFNLDRMRERSKEFIKYLIESA